MSKLPTDYRRTDWTLAGCISIRLDDIGQQRIWMRVHVLAQEGGATTKALA